LTAQPEARARQRIDRQLTDAGWIVQDRAATNLRGASGVVPGAQAQIAVEGLDRRQEGDPLAAALSHDAHDAGIEVDVVRLRHLRRPAQVDDVGLALPRSDARCCGVTQ